jgi:hypothetical protein
MKERTPVTCGSGQEGLPYGKQEGKPCHETHSIDPVNL